MRWPGDKLRLHEGRHVVGSRGDGDYGCRPYGCRVLTEDGLLRITAGARFTRAVIVRGAVLDVAITVMAACAVVRMAGFALGGLGRFSDVDMVVRAHAYRCVSQDTEPGQKEGCYP